MFYHKIVSKKTGAAIKETGRTCQQASINFKIVNEMPAQ